MENSKVIIGAQGKLHKFAAIIKFGAGPGYMEYSNSMEQLRKKSLIGGVSSVVIYEQKINKKGISLRKLTSIRITHHI